jgi:hypothetical protein
LSQHKVSDDASGRSGNPKNAIHENFAAVQQRLVDVLGNVQKVSEKQTKFLIYCKKEKKFKKMTLGNEI